MAQTLFVLLGTVCLTFLVTANASALKEPDGQSPAQQQNDTSDDLEPLPNKFADYDANKDGYLHYEEFSHAIMSVKTIGNPNELRGLFDQWDTNDDEKIDEKEFDASPISGKAAEIDQFGHWRHCHLYCGYRCLLFYCRVYCYYRCH